MRFRVQYRRMEFMTNVPLGLRAEFVHSFLHGMYKQVRLPPSHPLNNFYVIFMYKSFSITKIKIHLFIILFLVQVVRCRDYLVLREQV